MKTNIFTIIFLSSISCNLNAETPVRIFEKYICLPDGYILNTINSNDEFGINFENSEGKINRITIGQVDNLIDPTSTKYIPWIKTKKIKYFGLDITFYDVDKSEELDSLHPFKNVIINNEKEYLKILSDDINIWKDILNTLSDGSEKVCANG